ncbi:MAG: hypothetical protein SVV80_09730 [Planctomycetota bacterium]|nr:hypothetical protein [Planctomycetota bacterium]
MAPIASVIAGTGQKGLTDTVVWSVILLVAVSAFVVVIFILRRMLLNKSDRGNTGFTIDQIDRLRDENSLTEEEYRRARRAALGLNDPDRLEK